MRVERHSGTKTTFYNFFFLRFLACLTNFPHSNVVGYLKHITVGFLWGVLGDEQVSLIQL